jgi:hydrogenase maturation factor
MANPITRQVNIGPRNHRSICSGLILHAVCKNPNCSVFNKECCINKKIGKFHIGK